LHDRCRFVIADPAADIEPLGVVVLVFRLPVSHVWHERPTELPIGTAIALAPLTAASASTWP
jgi:hypothetical protein